jgi:hypothetical protein
LADQLISVNPLFTTHHTHSSLDQYPTVVTVHGFRVQGSGFRVQGSGFRVQRFRVQRFRGSGFTENLSR